MKKYVAIFPEIHDQTFPWTQLKGETFSLVRVVVIPENFDASDFCSGCMYVQLLQNLKIKSSFDICLSSKAGPGVTYGNQIELENLTDTED